MLITEILFIFLTSRMLIYSNAECAVLTICHIIIIIAQNSNYVVYKQIFKISMFAYFNFHFTLTYFALCVKSKEDTFSILFSRG